MNRKILAVILRRIATSILILYLLITFIFLLVRLSPGDPAQKFISPQMSPMLAEKVSESFNLNKPVLEQYVSFLLNIAGGDLGVSYSYRQPVIDVVANRLPLTVFLAFSSVLIQTFISLILAFIAIRKINGFADRMFSKLSLVIYATPAFVLGVFLIFIFSVKLNLLPSSDLKSIDFDGLSTWGKFLDYAGHLILPLITLTAAGIALFYRYLRDNLGDVYNKTFILNLRANGYSEKEIVIKHVIPNAVGPLISIAGIELGILLGGTLITEVIFGLPGMGRLTIEAIMSRDYPLVIGCSALAGIMIILANFIADLVRVQIDKRSVKELFG